MAKPAAARSNFLAGCAYFNVCRISRTKEKNIMKLLIRWFILAVAIFLTAWLLPGIHVQGANAFLAVAVVAVILGFVNAVVRPILAFLSCGLILLTFGLFMFVINGAMLLLTSQIAQTFGIGFYVDGWWPAVIGSVVITIISSLLSAIFKEKHEK
jgi:putative membrane protein